MSLEATAWALRQKLACPTAKLILISLADHHNASTGKCFPSRAKLAEAGCCSEATVKRKLRHLEAEGWITVEAHFTPSGRQDRNSYTLHFGRNGGGGHSEPLPENEPDGGAHSSEPHEGCTTMSPLNRKNNGKKERAGARNDQIDLEEAIAAADAARHPPDAHDEAHRMRMKEGFQGLIKSLRGNTTQGFSGKRDLTVAGGRMRPGVTGNEAAQAGAGTPTRA